MKDSKDKDLELRMYIEEVQKINSIFKDLKKASKKDARRRYKWKKT